MLTWVYNTSRWRRTAAAAKARDGHRCTVARLLGGSCKGRLHAHHIVPVNEGGSAFDLDNVGTTCAGHHPQWEALRRTLLGRHRRAGDPGPVRCPHQHRSVEARRICEERMERQRQRSVAA